MSLTTIMHHAYVGAGAVTSAAYQLEMPVQDHNGDISLGNNNSIKYLGLILSLTLTLDLTLILTLAINLT